MFLSYYTTLWKDPTVSCYNQRLIIYAQEINPTLPPDFHEIRLKAILSFVYVTYLFFNDSSNYTWHRMHYESLCYTTGKQYHIRKMRMNPGNKNHNQNKPNMCPKHISNILPFPVFLGVTIHKTPTTQLYWLIYYSQGHYIAQRLREKKWWKKSGWWIHTAREHTNVLHHYITDTAF